jgi:hypothetical protein
MQLKRAIESFPRMMSNTLHRFTPLAKFHIDKHFIYIIVHGDEHKEEILSYYKLVEEDMEEITKEWLAEFLEPDFAAGTVRPQPHRKSCIHLRRI